MKAAFGFLLGCAGLGFAALLALFFLVFMACEPIYHPHPEELVAREREYFVLALVGCGVAASGGAIMIREGLRWRRAGT